MLQVTYFGIQESLVFHTEILIKNKTHCRFLYKGKYQTLELSQCTIVSI